MVKYYLKQILVSLKIKITYNKYYVYDAEEV